MKLLHRIVCLMVISLLISLPALAAQEIGSVAEVTGGVDIMRGGKLPAEPAKVGEKVVQGDVIRTKSGGKVQLHFKDDSVLTIAPDSRVALNEYVYEPENNKREASIKIFQGLVHTVVNKVIKKDTPDFTVETQTAVIGVRGTDWFTQVGPAVSDIYNNTGITEVRNIFAEIPGLVKLRGREYTQVSKNLPPTLPLPLSQDDINWIKNQMNPKVAAKATGNPIGQAELLSNIAGSTIQTQTVSPTTPTAIQSIETNIIQNLQSAVFVPPQPVPLSPVQPPTNMLPTPFNIAISWGSGAQDLDLYLQAGTNTPIYFGNQGSTTSAAYYHLDSVVANGGEVITVNSWTAGQTYYAYVKDYTNGVFPNPNPNSTVLSSSSGVNMQLFRGGTVSIVSIPNGSKASVTGGTQVGQTYTVPSNLQGTAGNQWQVVSINPSTGVITPINTINPYDAAVPPVAAAVNPVPVRPAALVPASATATRSSVTLTTVPTATAPK
jgi:hypothetical protein